MLTRFPSVQTLLSMKDALARIGNSAHISQLRVDFLKATHIPVEREGVKVIDMQFPKFDSRAMFSCDHNLRSSSGHWAHLVDNIYHISSRPAWQEPLSSLRVEAV